MAPPLVRPCALPTVRSNSTIDPSRSCESLFAYPSCELTQLWSLICGACIVRGPLVGEGLLVASCAPEIGRRETRWRRLCFHLVPEGKIVISPFILFDLLWRGRAWRRGPRRRVRRFLAFRSWRALMECVGGLGCCRNPRCSAPSFPHSSLSFPSLPRISLAILYAAAGFSFDPGQGRTRPPSIYRRSCTPLLAPLLGQKAKGGGQIWDALVPSQPSSSRSAREKDCAAFS
jgi:hypothetical protein